MLLKLLKPWRVKAEYISQNYLGKLYFSLLSAQASFNHNREISMDRGKSVYRRSAFEIPQESFLTCMSSFPDGVWDVQEFYRGLDIE